MLIPMQKQMLFMENGSKLLLDSFGLKRVGSTLMSRYKFIFGPGQRGEVSFRHEEAGAIPGYHSKGFHSFSNDIPRREYMWLGRTHVAVRFVDLSSLRVANLEVPTDWDGEPVRWVGYETSVACVAKTLVIERMIRGSAKWADGVKATRGTIGGLKRRKDRDALCRYVITGDLFPAQPGAVGSVTMFADVPGWRCEPDECALGAVDFSLIVKEMRHVGVDVVEAAGLVLRRETREMMRRIRDGEVRVEARLAVVEKGSPVVYEIRALEPFTMSWSNVSDYLAPRDFHDLARACSAPEDTVHFGYR